MDIILSTSFATYALNRPLYYDRVILASSLGALELELKTMSGFFIAIIGQEDIRKIAFIQHAEIINFDQHKNLPSINLEQLYSTLEGPVGSRSLLRFSREERSLLKQSLHTSNDFTLLQLGNLDKRLLACLIQEVGEANAYPLQEIVRADRMNDFMDDYTRTISNHLEKGEQVLRVNHSFYSAAASLCTEFFQGKPGIVTKITVPRGGVYKISSVSNYPEEGEYLLPPGQQLLYTASGKEGKYNFFKAKPIRTLIYEKDEPNIPEKISTSPRENKEIIPAIIFGGLCGWTLAHCFFWLINPQDAANAYIEEQLEQSCYPN